MVFQEKRELVGLILCDAVVRVSIDSVTIELLLAIGETSGQTRTVYLAEAGDCTLSSNALQDYFLGLSGMAGLRGRVWAPLIFRYRC